MADEPDIPHVVMIVHGIRDHAEWEHEVERILANEMTFPIPIKFGWFDAAQFLCPPLAWLIAHVWREGSPYERVRMEFDEASVLYTKQRLSVIAHSFGTLVTSKIIRKSTHLRFWRVVFCGSVVKSGYPWNTVKGQIGDPLITNKRLFIVNDCGSGDKWPAIAQMVTLGFLYGAAGTDGFGSTFVTDRYHKGNHSYFLTAEFVEKYWKPFIHDGIILIGEGRPGADLGGWFKWLRYLFSRTFIGGAIALWFLWSWATNIPPVKSWAIEEYLRRRALASQQNDVADFEKDVVGSIMQRWICKVVRVNEENKVYWVVPLAGKTQDQISVRFKNPDRDFDKSIEIGTAIAVRGKITGIQGNVTRMMEAEIIKD